MRQGGGKGGGDEATGERDPDNDDNGVPIILKARVMGETFGPKQPLRKRFAAPCHAAARLQDRGPCHESHPPPPEW